MAAAPELELCRYEICKKKGKFDDAIKEMEDRIARNFCHHGRVQCGIVYCLSRNDCEKVAAELQVRLPLTSITGSTAIFGLKRGTKLPTQTQFLQLCC